MLSQSIIQMCGKPLKEQLITFVSLLSLPEINFSDWFELSVPQPNAAISPSSGKAFFTGIHAKNSSLSTNSSPSFKGLYKQFKHKANIFKQTFVEGQKLLGTEVFPIQRANQQTKLLFQVLHSSGLCRNLCAKSSDTAYLQNFTFSLGNIMTRTIEELVEHLK